MNEWGGQPLPISASAWVGGELRVRLSGAALRRGRASRARRPTPSTMPRRCGRLREQHASVFRGARSTSLWRLSVPPTTPPLELRAPADRVGRRACAGCARGTRRRARCAHSAAALGGTRRCFAARTRQSPACSSRSSAAVARINTAPEGGVRPGRHLQSRPNVPAVDTMETSSPTGSGTRPRARRPTRSCASASIADSARPRARPISCSATSSTARAAAST